MTSEHETVAAIKAWHARTGRVPTATEWRSQKPSVSTIQRQFGSFSEGIKAAGLIPRRPGRQPNGGTHGTARNTASP